MPSRAPASGSRRREGEMSTRSRTLAVGGVLLAVLVAGLLVGFLALGNDDQSSGTTTTPPVTTSATPTDPRAQVEQAYLDAWDVWADALLKLDASRLPEAFTGRALSVITAKWRNRGRTSRFRSGRSTTTRSRSSIRDRLRGRPVHQPQRSARPGHPRSRSRGPEPSEHRELHSQVGGWDMEDREIIEYE